VAISSRKQAQSCLVLLSVTVKGFALILSKCHGIFLHIKASQFDYEENITCFIRHYKVENFPRCLDLQKRDLLVPVFDGKYTTGKGMQKKVLLK